MSEPTVPVELLMRPLVTVGINANLGRFTVNCLACGPNIQETGEGGFDNPDDAQRLAQQHRQEHFQALYDEVAQTRDDETHELEHRAYQTWPCIWETEGHDSDECPIRREIARRRRADAIYDVLVRHAGAVEEHRPMFVHFFVDTDGAEYRFMGALGFGGKYWRTDNVVNCYPEDETLVRCEVIEQTNAALAQIRR